MSDPSPTLCVMRTQGITNPTLEMMIHFLVSEHSLQWHIAPVPPDAAVDRARSIAASKFLQTTNSDVLVMVDYDIELARPVEDLEYLARKCQETKGIVGAVVGKKGEGQGFGGRFVDGQEHEMYTDKLVPLGPGQFVGGALTAYHRDMFKALIAQGAPYCTAQGFWPFFIPTVELNEGLGTYDYLSEDWAICSYAREAGSKVHAALRPCAIHHGRKGYTTLEANHHVRS